MTNPVYHDYSAGFLTERKVLSIRGKAFPWQKAGAENRVIVDADCRILVWIQTDCEYIQDYENGYFTEHHSLRIDVQRKIRMLLGLPYRFFGR